MSGRSKEIAALLLGNWEFQALHHVQQVLPDHAFGALGFVVEDVGGWKEGMRGILEFIPSPVDPPDLATVVPKQALDGSVPKGNDDFGFDNGNLSLEGKAAERILWWDGGRFLCRIRYGGAT